MTARLMRKATPFSLIRAQVLKPKTSVAVTTAIKLSQRGLANVREADGLSSQLWFDSSTPRLLPVQEVGGPGSGRDHKPPDERTLKLGKTIRVLHERLPTLLATPLPQEILSPQITLHLFPSTHPHLPTVTGKIAYAAALWTSPVAWGRVPIVGNIKLIVLSERMTRTGERSNEKLIVKWKTCGKTKGKGVGALYRGISGSERVDKITELLGGDTPDDEEFTGLFFFEFDGEGRIVTHTIEHANEGGNWEKTTKVISVTDWLLGKAWGKKEDEVVPGLAFGYCDGDQYQRKNRRGRGR